MDQRDFINTVIVNQLGDIVKLHPYLSFGLIATGIELLGGCIDKHTVQKDGESGNRFRNAILKLFPVKYHQFAVKKSKFDLYSELRCGLNHSFLPKPTIGLSERKSGNVHLSIVNNTLILLAEDLYEDLQVAGQEVIKLLDDGLIYPKFELYTV